MPEDQRKQASPFEYVSANSTSALTRLRSAVAHHPPGLTRILTRS